MRNVAGFALTWVAVTNASSGRRVVDRIGGDDASELLDGSWIWGCAVAMEVGGIAVTMSIVVVEKWVDGARRSCSGIDDEGGRGQGKLDSDHVGCWVLVIV